MSMLSAKVSKVAFDIGSGSIKMLVGNFVNNKLVTSCGGSERPVLFGTDWLRSTDGNLSTEIQDLGLATLRDLKEIAVNKHNASDFVAIATEVFRKAKNGQEFLDKVKDQLNLNVIIIKQEMEAEIGYATGIGALNIYSETIDDDNNKNNNTKNPIIWDSGSASFQMTRVNPNDSSKYDIYMAAYGTSVVSKLLLYIMNKNTTNNITKSTVDSINPCTIDCVQLLIQQLMDELPPVVPWLLPPLVPISSTCMYTTNTTNHVIAIGGRNSMFHTAKAIVLYHQGLEYTNDGMFTLTRDAVWECISHCVNKTDDLLYKYVDFEYSDGSKSIIPKLCLLYSVMNKCKLDHIQVVFTYGSCLGILNSSEYWE